MKLLYSAHTMLMVGHVRNLLAAHGIESSVRNEFLSGAAGELPMFEAWPELWVREQDYERAKAVIDEMLAGEESHSCNWTCPRCGERLEGQFDTCWHCGASRPEEC